MRKTKKELKEFPIKLWHIILLGLVLRIFLSFFGTLQLDFNTFVAWSNSLSKNGFAVFYQGWSDYLPGYLYILWAIAKLKIILPIPEVLLYKLPAILADLLTIGLIYKITKEKSHKIAVISSISYALNPAILSNSTLWGQVDSITSLFSLLSLLFLTRNIPLSALFFALGILIKPQTVFIAPIIAVVLLKKKNISKILTYAFIGVTVTLLAFYPFSNTTNIAKFVFERVSLTLNQYPYTSVNTFNFWALFGMWKEDTKWIIPQKTIGYLVSATLYLIWFVKNKNNNLEDNSHKFKSAAVWFLISFLFFTRIHERHMLPVLAPLLIGASFTPSLWIPYLVLSSTYTLNMLFSHIWISNDFQHIFSDFMVKLLSLINLSTVFLIYYSDKIKLPSLKNIKLINKKKSKEDAFSFTKVKLKHKNKLLLAIIVFSLVTRIFQLQNPSNEYFDEVYHAFTARVMLNADPKAWEWWNTPPEGFAYEWTHPPLAKLAMVASMMVFGENSFAWRLPAALLGTLTVFVIYKLTKQITNDETMSLLASFVYSLEGIPLVISRIGMNDAYLVFFSLTSLLALIKKKNFVSSVFLGLALASKWSALWAIPILFLAFLVFVKKVKPSLLYFLFVPVVIYVASYIPMFTSGHGWDIFIGMQKQMWWYHTSLVATHPYTSQWFTWPFLIRPVWLYTSSEPNLVRNIYMFGNPLLSWFGIFSIFYLLFDAIKHKSKKEAFVTYAYASFFVPWALSPRIMFLYHYAPSIPFMSIAVAYVLRKHKRATFNALFIFVLSFIYFYPHFTGIQIPKWLDNSYYWLESWR